MFVLLIQVRSLACVSVRYVLLYVPNVTPSSVFLHNSCLATIWHYICQIQLSSMESSCKSEKIWSLAKTKRILNSPPTLGWPHLPQATSTHCLSCPHLLTLHPASLTPRHKPPGQLQLWRKTILPYCEEGPYCHLSPQVVGFSWWQETQLPPHLSSGLPCFSTGCYCLPQGSKTFFYPSLFYW